MFLPLPSLRFWLKKLISPLSKMFPSADLSIMEGKPQSSSEKSTERDLLDVRELLRDAQTKEDGQKYRHAAEIILQKILFRDPSNEEAKNLWAQVRSPKVAAHAEPRIKPAPEVKPPEVKAVAEIKPAPALVPVLPWKTLPATPLQKEAPGPVSPPKDDLTVPTPPAAGKSVPSYWLPILVAASLALAAGVVVFSGGSAEEQPVAASQPEPELPVLPLSPQLTDAGTAPAPSLAEVAALNTVPSLARPRPTYPNQTPAAAAAAKAPEVTPIPAMGNLAVSSPIAADIYVGDKYLGSTPGTFQVPAGKQTVEYRHGNLRSVGNYDIAPNETIAARVVFEIEVRVNARPWAQVYLEGAPRRSLGQTPLGSVKVPIGSVLIFENPNFPAKSHRITDQDSSIQMVFP